VIQNTLCIVLHRYAYSESSWILRTLSQNYGQVTLLAKGARRQGAALNPEPLTIIHAQYYYKEARSMHTLQEAALHEQFSSLRSSIVTTALGQVLCETVMRVCSHIDEPLSLYSLLRRYLLLLNSNTLQGARIQYVIPRFLLDLCGYLGFAMQMDNCLACGTKIMTVPADISLTMGGALCSSCKSASSALDHANHNPGNSDSLFSAVYNMYHLQLHPMSLQLQQEVQEFMFRYLFVHTGTAYDIKSLSFWNECAMSPQSNNPLNSP
jgi:DNA repair protein RecO (recombination protein O)